MAPQPFKFVYHRCRTRSGYDTRAGIMRVCAWMHLFKNYALKDWGKMRKWPLGGRFWFNGYARLKACPAYHAKCTNYQAASYSTRKRSARAGLRS